MHHSSSKKSLTIQVILYGLTLGMLFMPIYFISTSEVSPSDGGMISSSVQHVLAASVQSTAQGIGSNGMTVGSGILSSAASTTQATASNLYPTMAFTEEQTSLLTILASVIGLLGVFMLSGRLEALLGWQRRWSASYRKENRRAA